MEGEPPMMPDEPKEPDDAEEEDTDDGIETDDSKIFRSVAEVFRQAKIPLTSDEIQEHTAHIIAQREKSGHPNPLHPKLTDDEETSILEQYD